MLIKDVKVELSQSFGPKCISIDTAKLWHNNFFLSVFYARIATCPIICCNGPDQIDLKATVFLHAFRLHSDVLDMHGR